MHTSEVSRTIHGSLRCLTADNSSSLSSFVDLEDVMGHVSLHPGKSLEIGQEGEHRIGSVLVAGEAGALGGPGPPLGSGVS